MTAGWVVVGAARGGFVSVALYASLAVVMAAVKAGLTVWVSHVSLKATTEKLKCPFRQTSMPPVGTDEAGDTRQELLEQFE